MPSSTFDPSSYASPLRLRKKSVTLELFNLNRVMEESNQDEDGSSQNQNSDALTA